MIETYDNLDALPASLRVYGASDYATMAPRTGKEEPDYTEHGVCGIDAIGDLWFIDWWSGQVETDKSVAAFIALVGLHKPTRWFNEGGLIDKALSPHIRNQMRLTRNFVAIEQLPAMVDKAVKLQAFHAMATAGCIHFPVRRRWAEEVMDQLVKFPGGRWDDKADVCGLLGRATDLMFSANLPSVEKRPMLVPFTEAWLEYGSDPKPKVRYF
jgi:predicted phage terminase large subunit-like protein